MAMEYFLKLFNQKDFLLQVRINFAWLITNLSMCVLGKIFTIELSRTQQIHQVWFCLYILYSD